MAVGNGGEHHLPRGLNEGLLCLEDLTRRQWVMMMVMMVELLKVTRMFVFPRVLRKSLNDSRVCCVVFKGLTVTFTCYVRGVATT